MVRLAVYATLAPAFGIPLQSLAAHRRDGIPVPSRWVTACLVTAALLASLVGLVVLIAAMAGTAVLPVDPELLRTVLFATPTGTAFLIRFAALAVALAAAWCPIPALRLRIIIVATGIALGTLAWTGHGAMDEGGRGMVHLGADIVHLLAAGAWIGAIVAMLAWFRPGRRNETDVAAACRGLKHFGATGSVLVLLLIATGAVNGWIILGADGIRGIAGTRYGLLLIAKLVAFGGMLAMAAANRWWLTPKLGRAMARGAPDRASVRAVAWLRLSLATELAFGLAILGLVAWLGTVSPQG